MEHDYIKDKILLNYGIEVKVSISSFLFYSFCSKASYEKWL